MINHLEKEIDKLQKLLEDTNEINVIQKRYKL